MYSLLYSFISLLMQYIIPSIIVACNYLKMYFIFRESTKKLTAPATSFDPISHGGGGYYDHGIFFTAYYVILTEQVIADPYFLLRYVHHRHFLKRFEGSSCSEFRLEALERGPPPHFFWFFPYKFWNRRFSSFWVKFLKGPQILSFEDKDIFFLIWGPDI